MDSADFLALKTFICVAKKLSFRAAAEQLELAPSTVSQQINGLEARLGLRLLHRTTRSVTLTTDGQALFQQTLPLLENLADALNVIKANSEQINGSVRVHAFHSAAERYLDRDLVGFFAAYPGVRLDITTSDAPLDLLAGGYDLSLRLGEVLEPGLIARPLGGRLHQIVVAAPHYLASHPHPLLKPDDLLQHNCIGWRWPGRVTAEPWLFEQQGKTQVVNVSGNLVVDDRVRHFQAAIAGVGVAQLTAERVQPWLDSGALCRVLTEWESTFPGYYLCWTAGKFMSPAMRALIDWFYRDVA